MIDTRILNHVLGDENESLHILFYKDVVNQYALKIVSNQKNLIINSNDSIDMTLLYQKLSFYYPSTHSIQLLSISGSPITELISEEVQLSDLQTFDLKEQIVTIYIPPLLQKQGLIDFQELVAHLRSEDGCPWDREQTHKSLRTNLLEETYEVLTALDRDDCSGLEEELGDLLLQIMLHAQIATEEGRFNIEDVTAGIYDKLVYRHPHVFANSDVGGADEVIKNWEILKAAERKNKKKPKGMLSSIPKSMPALALAQDYQKRAARVGFDWRSIEPVKEKILEELDEVATAPNKEEIGKELGDVLFAMVNLVRWHGFDAESILREASARFADRFAFIEARVEEQGKTMNEFSLDQLDAFWDEAKANGK